MKLSANLKSKLFSTFLLLCFGSSTVLADTPFEALLNDEANGADWLSYSGGYKSQRFSPLSQINTANVDQLKVMWAYQMQPTGINGAASARNDTSRGG